MESINFKAYTKDISQIEAIKAFMKALKIKFELSKDSDYNPEFIKRIRKGERDLAEGKGIKISISEFRELCK